MTSKKIVVIGKTGQLARCLEEAFQHSKLSAIFLDRNQLNLEDSDRIEHFFQDHHPDIIVNAAAYTQVDRAETEKDLAYAINAKASEVLARCCQRYFYISTDYVYSGQASSPYTEADATAPVNFYGRTKLDGEHLAQTQNPNTFVIRTSWLYSPFGVNFVTRVAQLGRERPELKVVFDQIGGPTWAPDLAKVLIQMFSQDQRLEAGIYHFSNEGLCSWYDWAHLILKSTGASCKLTPIRTADYPTPAKRPAYSVLDKTKIKQALGIEIPHWTESFEQCKAKLF